MNVPAADEGTDDGTHEVDDGVVNIDPDFQSTLQEQQTQQSFSSFLELPEVIPARKRKQQQALLDFRQSKILTSEEYISACEQLLARRQETEAAAKRRVAERAANKDVRRREKEERLAGINQRKSAREAKRQEKDRLQTEKRACNWRSSR